MYTDKLAQDTLVKGQVGELDGFKVVMAEQQSVDAGGKRIEIQY